MSGSAGTGVRVGVLEDDRALRESLRHGLSLEGFTVFGAALGSEFLTMIERNAVDVMVIDIGLPDADGRDVAMAARAAGSDAPVLFLSARSSVGDRLAGFDAGADDYVVKPFVFDELVARLRVLSRRSEGFMSRVRFGAVELDPSTMSLVHAGGQLSLTPTEFRLLAALGSTGGVVRRVELIRAGWPAGAYASENTLDSYIARLRRKLHPIEGTPVIRTVHRVGYQLA